MGVSVDRDSNQTTTLLSAVVNYAMGLLFVLQKAFVAVKLCLE